MSTSSINYSVFSKEIVDIGKIYTLKDKQGFCAVRNSENKIVQPFFSKPSLPEKIIKTNDKYKSFLVHELLIADFIDKWLPGLQKDKILLGINWASKTITGYDVNPSDIYLLIEYEAKKIEDEFINAAIEKGDFHKIKKKDHQLYETMKVAYHKIERMGSLGLSKLRNLIHHENQYVRSWSASQFVVTNADEAIPVLKELACQKGLLGMGSKIVLDQIEKKEFNGAFPNSK